MAGVAGGTNPISVIDENPMSVRQWIVVAIMVLLNALDGFDVLSSAFAAPGISQAWGIPRSELGIVLSAELIGMGFGSILLGGYADKGGRKPAMLVCLVIMAIGMYLAHAATSVWPMIFAASIAVCFDMMVWPARMLCGPRASVPPLAMMTLMKPAFCFSTSSLEVSSSISTISLTGLPVCTS